MTDHGPGQRVAFRTSRPTGIKADQDQHGVGVAPIGGAGITSLENVLLPMRAAGKMSEKEMQERGLIGDLNIR